MKLREEFIQKCLADFHYELTREQMEQDWFLDKKNPYYREKDCYIFRTADNCWMEIATKDLDSAFTEPFVIGDALATEKKKKHNGGYYLKEKIAKLENELAQAESARNNYSAQLDRSRTDVHNLNIEVKELKEKLKDSEEIKKIALEEVENRNNQTERLHEEINELQTTIDQQSRKISQLTADLKVVQGNLEATEREHERQLKEMYDHMGWFKRMTWDWHHAPTFKEDERWNETH